MSNPSSVNLELLQAPMNQMQMQQLIYSLGQQVQQHDNVFQQVEQLQQALNKMTEKYESVCQENEKLRQEIAAFKNLQRSEIAPGNSGNSGSSGSSGHSGNPGSAQNGSGVGSSDEFPPLSFKTALNKGLDSAPRLSRKRQTTPPAPSLKKRLAAGRVFRSREDRGPQGYSYVYVGRTYKISRGEVRKNLRQAGVDLGRILDICFPASGVIGLLVHVQYEAELVEIMKQAQATVSTEFDPTDVKHLADPKYDSLSLDAREFEMSSIIRNRCLQTLEHLRPVQVASVARYFNSLGWLPDEEDVQDAIKDAAQRLAAKYPKRAAFAFQSDALQSDRVSEAGSDMMI